MPKTRRRSPAGPRFRCALPCRRRTARAEQAVARAKWRGRRPARLRPDPTLSAECLPRPSQTSLLAPRPSSAAVLRRGVHEGGARPDPSSTPAPTPHPRPDAPTPAPTPRRPHSAPTLPPPPRHPPAGLRPAPTSAPPPRRPRSAPPRRPHPRPDARTPAPPRRPGSSLPRRPHPRLDCMSFVEGKRDPPPASRPAMVDRAGAPPAGPGRVPAPNLSCSRRSYNQRGPPSGRNFSQRFHLPSGKLAELWGPTFLTVEGVKSVKKGRDQSHQGQSLVLSPRAFSAAREGPASRVPPPSPPPPARILAESQHVAAARERSPTPCAPKAHSRRRRGRDPRDEEARRPADTRGARNRRRTWRPAPDAARPAPGPPARPRARDPPGRL